MMQPPRILLAAVLMLASAMPVSAQTILQSTDKFTGQVHYSTNLREPKLDGGSFISMRYVHVGLHTFKPVMSVGRPYEVCFTAYTTSWVFISSGESLIFKLDGTDFLKVRGEGSIRHREVLGADDVSESACYSLSADELNRIAHTSKVEFRLVGEKADLTGTFKGDFQADALAFYQRMPELLGLDTPPADGTAAGALGPAAAAAADVTTELSKPQFSQDGAAWKAAFAESAKLWPAKDCKNPPRDPSLGKLKPIGVWFFTVTPRMAELMATPDLKGVVISKVQEGSAAAGSGFAPVDVVTQIASESVTNVCEFLGAIDKIPAGAIAKFDIWRIGKNLSIEVRF